MGLTISVPWLSDSIWSTATASIKDEKWKSSNTHFLKLLNMIHLDSGHHADRDLELAQTAAKYFGGTVSDKRIPTVQKRRSRLVR